MKNISDLELIRIGKVTGKSGFSGDIIISLDQTYDSLPDNCPFFIDIDKCFIPFFVSYIKRKNANKFIVCFDDQNQNSNLNSIIGRDVYIESSEIQITESYVFEVFKYKVFDKQTEIGIIENFIDIPANPVVEVLTIENKTVIIPLAKQLIIEIDDEKKIIYMDLPEGLLEINS